MNGEFTPTQRAMLKVLADGMPHTAEELHACLPDELGPLSNIRAHLTAIRKVLRPKGQDVLHRAHGGHTYYQLVRLLASAVNGRQ